MSTLGTLLATRLDAVLGTTLAQHPVLLEASRGNPAQPTAALHAQDNVIRRTEGEIRHLPPRPGEAGTRGVDGRPLPGAAGQAGRAGEQPAASSRTQLSEPARTILALLLSGMNGKAVVRGHLPLVPLPMPGAQGNAALKSATTPESARGSSAGTAAGGAGSAGRASLAGSGAAGTTNPGGAAGGAGSSGGGVAGSAGAAGAAGAATSGAIATAAGSPTGGAAPSAGPASASSASAAAAAGTARAALPPAPPGLLQNLQAALQNTVSRSGLFYESHLSQLAFGQRSAAELRHEPQARLSQAGSGQNTASGAGPTAGSAAASGGGAAGQAGSPAAAAASASATVAAPPAGAATTAATAATQQAQASAQVSLSVAASGLAQTANQPLGGIHPDSAALVRQQLEALANQAFAWQGQVWQDAPMDWRIQRHQAQQGEESAHWSTQLRVQLPRLGEVEARLTLVDQRLVLRLAAPESAPLLQSHLDVLRERLQSQGIALTDTAIDSEVDKS